MVARGLGTADVSLDDYAALRPHLKNKDTDLETLSPSILGFEPATNLLGFKINRLIAVASPDEARVCTTRVLHGLKIIDSYVAIVLEEAVSDRLRTLDEGPLVRLLKLKGVGPNLGRKSILRLPHFAPSRIDLDDLAKSVNSSNRAITSGEIEKIMGGMLAKRPNELQYGGVWQQLQIVFGKLEIPLLAAVPGVATRPLLSRRLSGVDL